MPITYEQVVRLAAAGESETLELKKSTAQLSGAAETLCAFLNASGGTVLIGVAPSGHVVGQQVADQTQQEIAAALRRFEPPAAITLDLIDVPGGSLQVIALQAAPSPGAVPFTYNGRAFERIGTTTAQMPQETYQRLLMACTAPCAGTTVARPV